MTRKKCVFCPIAKNFPLVDPYFRSIIFGTMATTYPTYHLGIVVSINLWRLKICFPLFVYYGQTPERIRIPLGTDVRLGPGDIVLDGGTAAPTFRPNALARILAGLHFTHNPYCPLGNARRAALVAILPDDCHPSTCKMQSAACQRLLTTFARTPPS